MSKNNPASVELSTDPDQYSYLQPEQIRFFEPDDGEEKPLRVNFSTLPIDALYTLSAEENARYMTADQMRRLSGNIKKAISHLKALELIELTIKDKPRSKNQRYKITTAGKARLDHSSS